VFLLGVSMRVKKSEITERELHIKMPSNPSNSAPPRPKCFSCGKDLQTRDELVRTGRSAGKYQIWLLCPDCVEKALALQLDFETRWLESKLYGKPKPNCDAYLDEKRAELGALRIPRWYWKWFLLHRVQHAYERPGAG